MGSHPLNLAFRFLLGFSALAAMGIWGWKSHAGALRFVAAFGIPLLAATLWGVLAVPNDPSRSGAAPLAVPGALRLALELSFFAFASWALGKSYGLAPGAGFGGAVVLHYALSYDRVMWLVTH